MNIYDTANTLAKELKESEEYKAYKKIKEEVKEDPELNEKVKDFETKRNQMQMLTLTGGTPLEEKATEIQTLYAQLIQIEKIKEYFEAEFKFSVILGDVNKIIGEAVRAIME